ncbi:hypothetical protein KSS87_020462, partial [Heliosperma pusillum]
IVVRDEDDLIGLPRQLWSSLKKDADGETYAGVGWLLDRDLAISSCILSSDWQVKVNFSSGRYFSGKDGDIARNLPFDAGFEAVGIIAAVGDAVNDVKVGSAAAVMTYGSYAEFMIVPSKFILPVARPEPEVVAMLTSGLTASIALEQAAQMGSGKTVMITAAAGGTGQFAVQVSFFNILQGI